MGAAGDPREAALWALGDALVALSRAASVAGREAEALQTLAERGCQLLRADVAFVSILSADRRVLALGHHGLRHPFPAEGAAATPDGPIIRATETSEVVVAHYGPGGEPLTAGMRTIRVERIRSAAYVPLTALDGIRGSLMLGWRTDYQPSADELRLAETLGGYAGALIAREQTERALRESEARYRAIVETAQEGICTTDASGRLTYVNARLCEMLGCWPTELLGRRETDLLSPAGGWSPAGAILGLLPPGLSQADFTLLRKDGSDLPASVSTGPISAADPAAGGITLFTDITERKLAEDRLRTQAFYDALTGLPNRTLFEDRVQQAILATRRALGALGLLFIDLDRFKEVNDNLGHDAGDELLRQVGQRLQGVVREGDTVARFGGDEFLVLLASISGEEDAARAAERIRVALAMPFRVRDRQVRVGGSIGAAVYPIDGDGLDSLLRVADAAMYRVKRESRGS